MKKTDQEFAYNPTGFTEKVSEKTEKPKESDKPDKISESEKAIKSVSSYFKKELTPEQLKAFMNAPAAITEQVSHNLSPLWNASISDWVLRISIILVAFTFFSSFLTIPYLLPPKDLRLMDKVVVIVGKTYCTTMKNARKFNRGFWNFFESAIGFPAHLNFRWLNEKNGTFVVGRNTKWFTLKAKLMSLDMEFKGLAQIADKIDLDKSFGFAGLPHEFLSKDAKSESVPVRLLFPVELLRQTVKEHKPIKFQPVFYLHGGAWAVGSRNTSFYEKSFEKLFSAPLDNGNIPIPITVTYRRAPELPHPMAIMDCFSAVSFWMNKENHEFFKSVFEETVKIFRLGGKDATTPKFDIEFSKIILGGDSSGGQLSLSTAALIRDQFKPKIDDSVEIEKLILIYPAIGISKRENAEFKTFYDFLTMFNPNTVVLAYSKMFREKSANKANFKDDNAAVEEFLNLPQVNAMKTEKSLKGLAKKYLFMTAKYDHMRGDAILMMDELKRSGENDIKWIEYITVHGFFGQNQLQAGVDSRADLYKFLTGKQYVEK